MMLYRVCREALIKQNGAKMIKAIQAWFKARFMMAVIVPEYKGIHWCWNRGQVYDWLLQYPAGVQVVLVNVYSADNFIMRAA